MPTLKYKDGSTWKSLSLGGKKMVGATSAANGAQGEVPQPLKGDQNKFLKGNGTWGIINVNPPTSFAGASPDVLAEWAEDAISNPQNYTQLLGQSIDIEYNSEIPTAGRASFTLVGLNSYMKTGTNEPAGFTFMSNSLKTNGIVGETSKANTIYISYNKCPDVYYASSITGSFSSNKIITPIASKPNNLYDYCKDIFPTYIQKEWNNIIKTVDVKTYFSGVDTLIYYEDRDKTTVLNPMQIMPLQFFFPSIKNINFVSSLGSSPSTSGCYNVYADNEGKVFDYFIENATQKLNQIYSEYSSNAQLMLRSSSHDSTSHHGLATIQPSKSGGISFTTATLTLNTTKTLYPIVCFCI